MTESDPTTEEIEAMRQADREKRRKAFLADMQATEDKHRMRMEAVATHGPRQGPFVLVGAQTVIQPYEDYQGGKPPPRPPIEDEEKDEKDA